jgi:hypothetical protein
VCVWGGEVFHDTVCHMINHFCLQNCLYRSSKFECYNSDLQGCYTVLTSNVLRSASKDHTAFGVGSKMECHPSCRRIEVIFVLILILCSVLTVTIKMA